MARVSTRLGLIEGPAMRPRSRTNRVRTLWLLANFDTAGEVLEALVRCLGVSDGLMDRFGGVPCFAPCRLNPSHLKRPVSPMPRFRWETETCGARMTWRHGSAMTLFWRGSPRPDTPRCPPGGWRS